MGTSILKNLRKSLSNLRFPSLSARLNKNKKNEGGFLLKRINGGPLEDTPYFSALSGEDLSPTRQIYSYLLEDFKVVLGSCNGLVCLDNTTTDSLLWNPSTDESKIIPSNAMRSWSPMARMHCFAGAFGYDSRSHDFKLIRFIYGFERDSDPDADAFVFNNYETELYSLRSNSWKSIAHPGYFVLRNPCAYVDGCNYWLAYDDREHFVLAFNFATDELTSHSLPPDVVQTTFGFGGPSILDFVDFQGSLGVLIFPKLGFEKRFHLWVTDGQRWTKECQFSVAGVERPLGFWGRVLFFEGLNRQLMAYDINTREINKLCVYDFPRKMQLVPYVESNVSIQGLLGTSKASQIQMEEV